MSFNIGDFSKKFTGYTRSAHFEASITLPAWAQAKGYQDSDFLLIPDIKWNGLEIMELRILAFFKDQELHSIRELTGDHIKLLEKAEILNLEYILICDENIKIISFLKLLTNNSANSNRIRIELRHKCIKKSNEHFSTNFRTFFNLFSICISNHIK
jgi:hypothetical protein